MPVNMEDYIRLLETMVEQQKIHIQSQDARILEQEQAIAQLRALVDELRLLKSGLEETLEEFKRQLFGTKSEKTKLRQPVAGMNRKPACKNNGERTHPDEKEESREG